MTGCSSIATRSGASTTEIWFLVYGRDAAPLLVVECKRPEVALTPAVLEQAMRYNSVLGVRYLAVTNGKNTYLYRLEGECFVPCEHIPRYEEMLCQR